MIEIIETFYNDGTMSAETVGGKQVVRITERAARTIRDFYNPNAGTDARGGPARWKERRVPHVYIISHARGTSAQFNYDDAIRVAIHHASRKGA